MPNGDIGKRLVNAMIKDCERRELKESICECVAQQIRGLYALDDVNELRNEFRRVEPAAYGAVESMGDCVIKTQVGIIPPTIKEGKQS